MAAGHLLKHFLQNMWNELRYLDHISFGNTIIVTEVPTK